MHGRSTWPVSFLPQYLAGLQPTEPGWKLFRIAPIPVRLEDIQCTLTTVAGSIDVEIEVDEAKSHGVMEIFCSVWRSCAAATTAGMCFTRARVCQVNRHMGRECFSFWPSAAYAHESA